MQRVLITGGGTGIGRGIAQAVRAAGHEPILVGRRPAPLAHTAAELACPWIAGDVTTDPDDILARAGRVDHLVNNAGSYRHLPVEEWTGDAWQALLAVHTVAPALLSRAFAAQARSGGSITNIGSTLSERPIPGSGPYTAAKAALAGLTRALAVELGPSGIRANCLLPGVVRTEMTTASRGGDDPEARLRQLTTLHPVGRLGLPADIGAAVCWLIDADWVTGVALPVDGGLLLGG